MDFSQKQLEALNIYITKKQLQITVVSGKKFAMG
jgi:hypothetical protein